MAAETAQPPTEEYLNEYSGGTLIGLSIGFAALTTVVLVLRFYARVITRRVSLGLDDAFLVAAYIVNLGMRALGISEWPSKTAPRVPHLPCHVQSMGVSSNGTDVAMVNIGGVGQHVEAVRNAKPCPSRRLVQAHPRIRDRRTMSPSPLLKMAIVFLYLRVLRLAGIMRTSAFIILGSHRRHQPGPGSHSVFPVPPFGVLVGQVHTKAGLASTCRHSSTRRASPDSCWISLSRRYRFEPSGS